MPQSQTPDFSILTAAFNSAPYISETIESVLAQTHGNLEMLIVDDGSTDGTAELAEAYATKDPRIRVIRQRNGGCAAARNTAIRESHGRYFAILDSDDVWMPDYLARQFSLLATRPELDVISANAINTGGIWDGRPWREPSDDVTLVSLRRLIEFEESLCIMAVFRREVAERLNGFDGSLRRNEDYDLWLRASLAGYQCAFYGRPLGYYRRRPDSMSGSEPHMIAGLLTVLEKVKMLCADRPDERALIEQRMGEFEERRLISAARAALVGRDFPAAAGHFDRLNERNGGVYRVLATVARRAPHLLLWAYAAKASLYPSMPLLKPRSHPS